MARSTSLYVCQQCGHEESKWHGKCPDCGEWGTLVETASTSATKSKRSKVKSGVSPVTLSKVPRKKTLRVSTKISELDRVLGGGIVPGQVVLLAGEPGIGKSTILLQVADKLGTKAASFLYVSGEESVYQTKVRADRLGIKNPNIQILEATDIDVIANTPGVGAYKGMVVDSIQTMRTSDLSGMAGSVGQVRECAYRLVRLAKENNVPIFMVGHVTKTGSVAGPAVLAHLVDTVLWFEGDKLSQLRLLRAVKNRFGPTDEVGIFTMSDRGLKSLTNPSRLFLSKSTKAVPGSATASVMQGTRSVLVEIQTLVVPTKTAYPKRIAQGIDSRKFEILLAVLASRVGIPLYNHDCFVSVVGGISVKNDPATDLAICLSAASAYFDKPLPRSTVAIGEVGLLGEVREVPMQDKRIREARRLGFNNVISQKKFKYLNQIVKKLLR